MHSLSVCEANSNSNSLRTQSDVEASTLSPPSPCAPILSVNASEVLAVNFRFAWLQSASAGLYVVYNEVDDRMGGLGRPRREFAVKYSRIFDVL